MQIHVWDHSNYVTDKNNPYPETAKNLKILADNGITLTIIYLPKLANIDVYLKAAAEAGLQVEAWIHPLKAIKNPPLRILPETQWAEMEHNLKLRLQGPCPNHPAYKTGIAQAATDLCQKYGDRLKAIHLDYIRSDNAVTSLKYRCQCEACRALRKRFFGFEVPSPEDLTNPAFIYKEYEILNDSVTAAVQAVRNVTNKYGLELSIAARTNYLNSADITVPPVWGLGPAVLEGQDWVKWADHGLINTINSMNYHTDNNKFTAVLEDHLRLLKGTAVKYFSGIGVYSSMGKIDGAKLREHLQILRDHNVESACLFNGKDVYSPEQLKAISDFAST